MYGFMDNKTDHRASYALAGARCAATRLVFNICFVCICFGCRSLTDGGRTATEQVNSRLAPAIEPSNTYPLARWRLVSPKALETVALWVSHILIRSNEAPGTQVCFGPPGWNALPPRPSRTRDDAHALAVEIAQKAQAAPKKFAELAREYSEDTVSRDEGGSLGGIAASELLRTPEILDALAVLHPGEVSTVVQTFCGFHVVYRRPAPPEESVSGSRIVIGYDNARWLHRFAAGRAIPARSRNEALALAGELFERARLNPNQFPQLVREYSEHFDARDDGDMGQWSTRDISPIPRELEVLQKLAINEIARPIDSKYGFEILQRTPQRPRRRFAMQAIQVFFDGDAPPDGPMSRTAALTTATEVAASLRERPETWHQLIASRCCEGIRGWSQGQAPRELEEMLAPLTEGEIVARPVQWNASFVIAKAVDPSEVPSHPVSDGIPAPRDPDIDYLWGRFGALGQRRVLLAIHQEMVATLNLSKSNADALEAIFGLNEPSQGHVDLKQIDAGASKLLGVDGAAIYRHALTRQLELVALSPAMNPRLHPGP